MTREQAEAWEGWTGDRWYVEVTYASGHYVVRTWSGWVELYRLLSDE